VVKLFKTQTNLNRFLFLHVFQISSLILLTVSLPPKRDAKVGKITVAPNNYTN
jgi:hypothetical protein